MTDFQRIQAYIVDVEQYLKLHDIYWRQVRTDEAEINLLNKAALPEWEAQKEQAIKERQMGQLQADEYFRAAKGFLFNLTGLSEVEDIRTHLITIKVTFNRVSEAKANLADASISLAIAEETSGDDDHTTKIKAVVDLATRELTTVISKLEALVPAGFAPFKSNLILA